jgi:hypothetical protein
MFCLLSRIHKDDKGRDMIQDATQLELRLLYKKVLTDAYTTVREVLEQAPNTYIGRYFEFPKFGSSADQFPSIHVSQYDNPKDYTLFFHTSDEHPFASLNSFNELTEYLLAMPELAIRLLPSWISVDGNLLPERLPGVVETHRDILETDMQLLCGSLIDRYIHLFGISDEISEEKLDSVIEPYVKFLINESLAYDVCVPIMFTTFEIEELELIPNVRIEAIPADYQLSRSSINRSSPKIDINVLRSATHWLVLANRDFVPI